MTKSKVCGDWYVTGGHCHFTPILEHFDSYEEFKHPKEVDGQYAFGKGDVTLQLKTKNSDKYTDLKLTNVLYVPSAPASVVDGVSVFAYDVKKSKTTGCHEISLCNEKSEQFIYLKLGDEWVVAYTSIAKYPRLEIGNVIGTLRLFERDAVWPIYLTKRQMQEVFGCCYPFQ